MSEHDKRGKARELWIWEPDRTDYRDMYDCMPEGILSEEYIHFREVRPDEITLTREELLGAFARAYCTSGNTHKVLDSEIGIAMAAELFPEGTDNG